MPIPLPFIIGVLAGAAATYLYQDTSSRKVLTDTSDKILDTTSNLAEKAGDLVGKAGSLFNKGE